MSNEIKRKEKYILIVSDIDVEELMVFVDDKIFSKFHEQTNEQQPTNCLNVFEYFDILKVKLSPSKTTF